MSTVKIRKRGVSVVEEFLEAANAKIEREGLNMSDLSRRAGVARPYLYRVLRGEQSPSFATAEKIAEALGLTFRVLEKTC